MPCLSESDRQQAASVLSALIGLPLTDMWRYAGFQRIEFGEQKPFINQKGEQALRADYALVLGGSWAIQGPEGFLLSSLHFPADQERRDRHSGAFYASLTESPPSVANIEVQADGGLRLSLTGGLHLQTSGLTEEPSEGEHWRFMPPDDSSSLVLDSLGLRLPAR